MDGVRLEDDDIDGFVYYLINYFYWSRSGGQGSFGLGSFNKFKL